MPHIHTRPHVLALHKTRHETARKRVARPVGVADVFVVDGADRDLLDVLATLLGDDGRLSALRNDDGASTLRIMLGRVRNQPRYLGHICALPFRQTLTLRPRSRLALIPDHHVRVRQRRRELILEYSRQKRRAQIQNKRLVGLHRFLAQCLDGLDAHSQVETADVVERRGGRVSPDLRRPEVVDFVLVRCREICAQTPITPADDHPTSSRRRPLHDHVLRR